MTDRELFIAALEQEDGQRDGWLDRACVGDAERRRRLDVLLRAHEMASKFLGAPVGDQTRDADPAKTGPADLLALLAPAAKPGAMGKLDQYEVHEVVGSG